MYFVDSLNMFHIDAKEIPCITGKGGPTEKTEGAPGVLYMDTVTGALYKCRAADHVNEVYVWEGIGGGNSDYTLPVGGMILGGVKNGGNVVINPDGTMTAPAAEGNADLTGYATERWVREGYQPKGEYLTEHQDISGKLDASALPEAIDNALAQAKAGGAFDGVSPEITVSDTVGGHRITINAANGIQTFEVLDGEDCKGTGAVPAYVEAEAERVAAQVYAHQNANTFSFLAVGDMHQLLTDGQIVESNEHAGQGMELVRRNCHIDFAAVLGDNGWGSGQNGSETSLAEGISEIRSANMVMDKALCGIPNFRTPGNHCGLVYNYAVNGNSYLSGGKLFPLYGAYNTGAVYPQEEKKRGYCYRDFEEHRLRVICLNTSDVDDVAVSMGKSIYISGTQLKWFAETLDLSDKENAGQWQILLLGHAPLDWGDCIHAVQIIKAYQDGTAVNLIRDGVSIACNYAGKNSAAIIGQVHGHIHNCKVDNLHYLDAEGDAHPLNVKRIAVPNACFTRDNEYISNGTSETNGIEFGEEVTYPKSAGTAEDTAFCVVTVDVVSKTVYADHYGAGIDRVIAYAEENDNTEETVNLVTSSIDRDGNGYNGGLGYKENYRLSSSGGESALTGAVVSGFIPVKSGDVIRVYGADSGAAGMSHNASGFYLNGYDGSFTFMEYLAPTDAAGKDGIWDQSGDKVLWTVDTALFATMPAYIRASMNFCTGADFIITVNQEIR